LLHGTGIVHFERHVLINDYSLTRVALLKFHLSCLWDVCFVCIQWRQTLPTRRYL